ncbi:DUF4390 domain-containing protein [Methylomonas sp. LL1]|uniref:DUF4390 domain-containing protein n=1 Tax=Methylomonas sp. LL1 TaxID=2785785 RepID=UPI0018C3F5F0|nr:DUF4390 domain-containing protein [Methylomonas sp. LL1]QPK61967.1 DUF4390 domain-containing protein [Methylomonas sp. LL1]
MPSWARAFSGGLLFCLMLWPLLSVADPFAAKIDHAELVDSAAGPRLQAQIDYQLSPTAKEALHKGVPLTWFILVKILEPGWLWDSSVYSQKLPYRLQFHALLNQYEVLTPAKRSEMFLTLNAALSFMAGLHDTQPIAAELLQSGQPYRLAIKCQFDRESLPVPLRPFAYLDSQWLLSSDWTLWPIQK